MSTARRTLLTATAAGTLLGALWFVPSANATVDTSARTQTAATTVTATAERTQQARAVSTTTTQTAGSQEEGTELADTGSIDTTPYVVGGTLFLAVGAGFVVYSVRRERLDL